MAYNPRDIASDLSYLVLKRQRREAELAGLQAHQSAQHLNAPRPIVGVKAECLRERLTGERQPLRDETRRDRHGF